MPPVKKTTASKLLGIDDILSADDRKTEKVECPEWGGHVEVRSLSREEVIEAIERSGNPEGGIDGHKFQMELIVKGLGVTEDRAVQLGRKHPAPLFRIETAVRNLSSIPRAGDARFQDSE